MFDFFTESVYSVPNKKVLIGEHIQSSNESVQEVASAVQKITNSIKLGLKSKENEKKEVALLVLYFYFLKYQYIFEPYFISFLPLLVECATENKNVSTLLDETATEMFAKISPYSLQGVLPVLESCLMNTNWRIVYLTLKLYSLIPQIGADKVGFLLPELVPILSTKVADTKSEIRQLANQTLSKCCSTISNPDVKPLIPKLISANANIRETPDAIEALLSTTFVNEVDRPTLAIIVPILNRGLKEKNSKLKRKCCVIIDNMCKLVNNPSDTAPFADKLLPYLKKMQIEESQVEVRDMADKARITLERSLGK